MSSFKKVTETPEELSRKNRTAYKFLFISGLFGGHQYYLGKWKKGLLMAVCFVLFVASAIYLLRQRMLTGGEVGTPLEWTLFYIGILGLLIWFYDLFTLPKQVEQARALALVGAPLKPAVKNTSNLASAICFKIYPDGQWVYYPWGPHSQGYVVPDADAQDRLTRFLTASLLVYALLWGLKLYQIFPDVMDALFFPYLVLFAILGRMMAHGLPHVDEQYKFSEMHLQAKVGILCVYILFATHFAGLVRWFLA